MKRAARFLLLVILGCLGIPESRAQNPTPKLAPLKAKYDADSQQIKVARDQAMAQVRDDYDRALANAEKSAAASRDLKTVAAVDRERQAVTDGRMAPAFPAELPAALQAARRDYLAGLARAAGEFVPRQQKLDQEYFAQLARIDASSDQELSRELAAEKQRVLEAAGTRTPATSESLVSKRSVVVNGDFSIGEPGGPPKGWEPAYPGGSAKVVADGTNPVLRIEVTGKPENAGVKQDVPIPAGARSATFRAKMRGKPKNAKTESRAAAQITLRIRDAKGENLVPSILTSKHSAQWQSEQHTLDLPKDAKSIEIVVRSIFAEGTFDFDDVSLEFK